MQRLLLLTALVCVGVSQASFAADGDTLQIRKLIPSASAMRREDFEKLAQSTTVPKASDLEDKSLTLMLLDLRPKDDAKAKEQFRYLTNGAVPAKPSELAKEIYRTLGAGRFRILTAPVTMIQANRITDFTCKVDGEQATGTVKFEVPRLYTGKVDYVAQRHEGKWQIQEFLMPAYKIHIVYGKDSTWKEKAEKPKSG